MNSIIITSVICISLIIVVGIFCYTSYKNDENIKSNKFFKVVNQNFEQYKIINKKLNNINDEINKLETSLMYIINKHFTNE